MSQWRKKPVVIEAIQFPEGFPLTVLSFVNDNGGQSYWPNADDGHVTIRTLEGDMIAMPGDWIIKGVKGEFYPCKPDIFEATYEPVS